MLHFTPGVDLECRDIASAGFFICRLWTAEDAETHVRLKAAIEQFAEKWAILETSLPYTVGQRVYVIVQARASLGTKPPVARSSEDLGPFGRPATPMWTIAERRRFVRAYHTGGTRACEAAFPGQPHGWIRRQLRKLREAGVITETWTTLGARKR